VPIYEFTCAACGKLSEVIQHVGDRTPTCPSCGSKRMKRAVSRTSFQLKGGGWYADLYSTPRPGAAGKDGKDGKQEPKPAETKPEASKGSGAEKPAPTQPPAKPATTDSTEPRSSRPSRRQPAPPRRRR
jgi:putative FmdB family regulatory protein